MILGIFLYYFTSAIDKLPYAFWTADSDLDIFIISDSSVNSCFKCLHPLLVLQQISVDVGPVPLRSTFKLLMVLHEHKSYYALMCWLGLYAKAHYEKHYLVRDSLSESVEVSFYCGTSTKANVGCLFKTRT